MFLSNCWDGDVSGTGFEAFNPDVWLQEIAKSSFLYFKTSPEIMRLAFMAHGRLQLSHKTSNS